MIDNLLTKKCKVYNSIVKTSGRICADQDYDDGIEVKAAYYSREKIEKSFPSYFDKAVNGGLLIKDFEGLNDVTKVDYNNKTYYVTDKTILTPYENHTKNNGVVLFLGEYHE